MFEMKCPFCGKNLWHPIGKPTWSCQNYDCLASEGMIGNHTIWECLIKQQKQLEIAKNRLGYIKNNYHHWTPDRDAQMIAQASNGLDEINAMDKSEQTK